MFLEPNDPLLKISLNFISPVIHQKDVSSRPQLPGYLTLAGRREKDLFDLVIKCLKEICNRISPEIPESGENLFSRIEAKLGGPHDKILNNLVQLYQNETLGTKFIILISRNIQYNINQTIN